jgi:hypothetical protein
MISLKKIMQEKHNKGEKGDTRILNFENSSNFLS